MTVLTKSTFQKTADLKATLCRVCRSSTQLFFDFGAMPYANGFLTEADFDSEPFYPLAVTFCDQCKMVQLVDQPKPRDMFHDAYPFYSSSSDAMQSHFSQFAKDALSQYVSNEDPFVLEIGSNDGTLLEYFKSKKIRHLGIDPSENVVLKAKESGIESWVGFFDQEMSDCVLKKKGQADLVLAANVMCHIADLHPVILAIKKLLKPKGVFIFEDPYLGDIYEKSAYDQIYDEHVFYFSLHSVQNLFARHDLEVIAVEPQATHGGSMRYIVAHQGCLPITESVSRLLETEKKRDLGKLESALRFRDACESSREKLRDLLEGLKRRGKRVMGYAATSKSTTILNYCGIDSGLVESICDTTPLKQGKYSPGMHLPIVPHAEFRKHYPDYAFLFGWNHQVEIFAKETEFIRQAGKWILHVPQVQVIHG